jgi:antitoxin HigA-1
LSTTIRRARQPIRRAQTPIRKARLPSIHPGEVLLEDVLKPLGLSQSEFARLLDVPPRRINEIILGKRAISADTALRLAQVIGTTPAFWLGLQAAYDLEEARLASPDWQKLKPMEKRAA